MDPELRAKRRRPDATPEQLEHLRRRAGLPTLQHCLTRTLWRWDERQSAGAAPWRSAVGFLYAWLGGLDHSQEDTVAAARSSWTMQPWSPWSRRRHRKEVTHKAHRVVSVGPTEGHGRTACGNVVPLRQVQWRRPHESRSSDYCARCQASSREPRMEEILVACEQHGSAFPKDTAWELRLLRILDRASPSLKANRLLA